MPSHEIAHCLERLRGLQQCLAVVLEGSVGADANAAVFLSVEIEQAIDELERNMPAACKIKESAVADGTRWPSGRHDCDDLGEDAVFRDETHATLTREAEMLANEHPETKA